MHRFTPIFAWNERRIKALLYLSFNRIISGDTLAKWKQEAHVGHCRSPEYNEHVKNLTSEWNQKQQSFIPHASRSLLCIRFVAVAFWAKKPFF